VKPGARSRVWSPPRSAFAGFRFPAEVILVAVNTGAGAAQGIDRRKALQKQVPTLTAIMADVVDALR
jgi:hypothetical protein